MALKGMACCRCGRPWAEWAIGEESWCGCCLLHRNPATVAQQAEIQELGKLLPDAVLGESGEFELQDANRIVAVLVLAEQVLRLRRGDKP